MKDLLKSNIYDCDEKIIIVGSCLSSVQPLAFQSLQAVGYPIFDVCLEQTHINMVITKVLGMIRAKKISEIIFVSVDKSPHCTQLHYIQDEIVKLGFETKFSNFVAVEGKLVKISPEAISLSKNLAKLQNIQEKNEN